jgi:hypothetical protein
MKALPDLEIEVKSRHITDDAVLVEVMIRGTHLGLFCRRIGNLVTTLSNMTLQQGGKTIRSQ